MKAALQQLVCPEVVLPVSPDKSVTVTETGAQAKLKQLTIKGLPDDAFVFELDHEPGRTALPGSFSQLSPYINRSHDRANKSCDLVIVVPNGEHAKVILADLKSTKPATGKCVSQLLNSKFFLEYVFRLLAEYHGIRANPLYRSVIFRKGRAINAKPLAYQGKRSLRGHEEPYFYQVDKERAVVQFNEFT